MEKFKNFCILIYNKAFLFLKRYYKYIIIFFLIIINVILMTWLFEKNNFSDNEKWLLESAVYHNNILLPVNDKNNNYLLNKDGSEILKYDKDIFNINKETNYFIIKKNNKYGVVSNTGEIILKPAYDFIELGILNHLKNIFLVNKKVLWVNYSGIAYNEHEWIIPLQKREQYRKTDSYERINVVKGKKTIESCLSPDNKLMECKPIPISFPPKENFIIEREDNSTTIKDLNGNFIAKTFGYTITPLGIVLRDNFIPFRGFEVGFVDFNGKVMVPMIYKEITTAAGTIIVESFNGKYGLYRADGKMLLLPVFDSISSFMGDYGHPSKRFLKVKLNNKFGVFDTDSNSWLIPTNFDYIDSNSDKYFILGNDGIYTPENIYTNGKILFYDVKKRDLLTDFIFDDAKRFYNGFAAVKKEGKWGYINTDGNLVIDFQYKDALEFYKAGLAIVQKFDNKFCYITTGGYCVKEYKK
ncbi:WG repeat-containing protein [bacterium]|nr:WG repeat-containing protein [bacterium]